MVNRVWHHLFGAGIVATVDNFGVLGQAPSHPELLDYLAHRFAADGWSAEAADSRSGSVADLSNVEPIRRRPTSKIRPMPCCIACGCGGSRAKRFATRSWPFRAGSTGGSSARACRFI